MHREFGAGCRVVQLGRLNAVDGGEERPHDVGELFGGFHGVAFRVVGGRRGRVSAAMTDRRDNPCHNATMSRLAAVSAAVDRGDWA